APGLCPPMRERRATQAPSASAGTQAPSASAGTQAPSASAGAAGPVAGAPGLCTTLHPHATCSGGLRFELGRARAFLTDPLPLLQSRLNRASSQQLRVRRIDDSRCATNRSPPRSHTGSRPRQAWKGKGLTVLKTHCPHCNTRFKLDEPLVGKTARCKHCKRSFTANPDAVPIAQPAVPPPGKGNFKRRLSWTGAAVVVAGGIALLLVLLLRSDADRKLSDLQGSNADQRTQALVWPAGAAVQDGSRPKVTAVLEPFLFEGDPQGTLNPDLVLRAYLHWANQDNVPTMIRIVENPNLPAWSTRKTGLVMDALGKMQDERAVDVLVRKLADPSLRDQAVTALQFMGPKAELAVLDSLFDPDPAARAGAGQLLADYGTNPRTIAAAALDRLKSNQPELQASAVAWFADNPPAGGAEQTEVVRLL